MTEHNIGQTPEALESMKVDKLTQPNQTKLTPADVLLTMQFEKPEFIVDEMITTG